MKWRTNYTIALTAVVSAAAGAGATYLAVSKTLEKKYSDLADREIKEAKAYYQEQYSRPTFVEEPAENESDEDLLEDIRTAAEILDGAPIDLAEKASAAIREYSPEAEEIEEDESKASTTVVNIFNQFQTPSQEVQDAILADQDPSKPYIITKEMYYENEPEHEQKQFTYYEGDDILVDDQEEYNPVVDNDMVAGDDNLMHFGYGSGDENVVYIRNETLDPPLDLHITKSSGKYSVEVLNFVDDIDPHLSHSQKRFRLSDDD